MRSFVMLALCVGSLLAVSGCGDPCKAKAGYVTCGYCNEDRLLSGNPHAGTCRYCKAGYACSGDICGDDLTCVAESSGSGGSPNSPQPSSGTCPAGTTPCGAGYCAPTGAVCCASAGHPELYCSAGTTCTPPGACFAPGGSTGGMGECGTCSGNLQCSGWMQGTSCNWQSCTCYYILNNSDVWKSFYHSDDGQCFQCATNGTICTAAAQSLINHCY